MSESPPRKKLRPCTVWKQTTLTTLKKWPSVPGASPDQATAGNLKKRTEPDGASPATLNKKMEESKTASAELATSPKLKGNSDKQPDKNSENNAENSEQEDRRRKMAQAAEKRRVEKTPDFTPVEEEKSQIVADAVSGTSKAESKGEVSPAADAVPSTSKPRSAMDRTESQCSETLEVEENSPELFTDEENDQLLVQEAEALENQPASTRHKDTFPWRGTPKAELNTTPKCAAPQSHIKPSPGMTVLFKVPIQLRSSDPPRPFPDNYRDMWDGHHVKMPCSPENLYPVEGKNGKKELKSRWGVITKALSTSPIRNSLDLEESILSYNARFAQRWDFRGLHAFFMDVLDHEESGAFFEHTLPKMVELALLLPKICTQPVPLLKKGRMHSLTFTQQQAACLLANAFFCTFPRRNSRQKQSEYSSFPDINFNSLFQGTKNGVSQRKAEKLKCICNYFRRVTTKMPTGTITFLRQCLREMPSWDKSSTKLSRLHVSAVGNIEDDGKGMLQVDFANKFLGGGVLGFGCVQEEIRFLICPELILSRLVTEVLDPNECLIMIGCEQFSTYTGYGDTFRWSGNFVDKTPRDTWGRLWTKVVAIDAIHYSSPMNQFKTNMMKRELNKAYCGFTAPNVSPKHLSAVATGNWGCGAFGGDLRLKALIQLMAAAEAKRDVAYFTFGNWQLKEDLYNMHKMLKDRDLSVSDLWSLLMQYYKNECNTNTKPKRNVFQFIERVFSGCESDTEEETDSQEACSNWEADYQAGFNSNDNKPEPDWAASTP